MSNDDSWTFSFNQPPASIPLSLREKIASYETPEDIPSHIYRIYELSQNYKTVNDLPLRMRQLHELFGRNYDFTPLRTRSDLRKISFEVGQVRSDVVEGMQLVVLAVKRDGFEAMFKTEDDRYLVGQITWEGPHKTTGIYRNAEYIRKLFEDIPMGLAELLND